MRENPPFGNVLTEMCKQPITAQRKTWVCGNNQGRKSPRWVYFAQSRQESESLPGRICTGSWVHGLGTKFAQPHSALLEMIPSLCDVPGSKIISTCKAGIPARVHKGSRESTPRDETEECRLQGAQDRQVCKERSAFLLPIFNSWVWSPLPGA